MRDTLDKRIIRELQRNARASTSTIAQALGVARSTVHERIARMEKDGTIAGYSVVLSRNPGDETVQILMMLEIRQQDTRKVLQRLNTYPEIQVVFSINGEFDLFLSAEAPRVEDLDILIDEIGEIPGVVRTTTSVVFGRRIDRRSDETAERIFRQMQAMSTLDTD